MIELLKAGAEYYSARAKAERYYHTTKERLFELMRRSDNGKEYQKINDTYRALKTAEISAWEKYYSLLDVFGYEYESAMKSILRHISAQ